MVKVTLRVASTDDGSCGCEQKYEELHVTFALVPAQNSSERDIVYVQISYLNNDTTLYE